MIEGFKEQDLDIALDKKDVKRKRARRLERAAKRSGETPREKSRPGEISREIEVAFIQEKIDASGGGPLQTSLL